MASMYDIEPMFSYPVFKYNKRTKLVNIDSGEFINTRNKRKVELFPFIGKELEEILGLNIEYQQEYENRSDKTVFSFKNIKLIKGLLKGVRPVDLSRGTTVLFVYCDIIKPALVGDTYAQLLRVIPIPKVAFGETIHKSFDVPHYYPLTSSIFSSIEIDPKDDTGERIKFVSGRVYAKLHFRRK